MKKNIRQNKTFVDTEHRKSGEPVSMDFEETPGETKVIEGDEVATVEAKVGRQ